jgi:hypothetical protein
VLTAWARFRGKNGDKNGSNVAVQKAAQLIKRMEWLFQRGNALAEPNAITYNIFISVLAQSSDPDASDRALEMLETMKTLDREHGRAKCRPDCVTYTTIINALANKPDGKEAAADSAIQLLTELEQLYEETNDPAYRPNIQTYCSVSVDFACLVNHKCKSRFQWSAPSPHILHCPSHCIRTGCPRDR